MRAASRSAPTSSPPDRRATAAGFGRLWSDIAPRSGSIRCRVMQAFATHNTWSSITLNWRAMAAADSAR